MIKRFLKIRVPVFKALADLELMGEFNDLHINSLIIVCDALERVEITQTNLCR